MFVFSDRREHLLVLRRLLVGLYKITGELMYNDDDFIEFEYNQYLNPYELKDKLFIETNLLIVLRNYRLKELGL